MQINADFYIAMVEKFRVNLSNLRIFFPQMTQISADFYDICFLPVFRLPNEKCVDPCIAVLAAGKENTCP